MMGVSGWKRGIHLFFLVVVLFFVLGSESVEAQQCIDDGMCLSDKPYCDLVQYECVECTSDSHCSSGYSCIDGNCESDGTASPSPATLRVRSSPITGVSITQHDGTGSVFGSVNSNPSSGVGGTTAYDRTRTGSYSDIVLSAPSTAQGRAFLSWTGCSRDEGIYCLVSVASGSTRTITANYAQCGTNSHCGSPYCSGTYTRVTPTCISGSCATDTYDCRNMGTGYTCNSGVCEPPPFSSASCTVNGQSSDTVQVTPGSTVTFGLSADPTTGTCMLNYGDGTSNTGECVRTVYKSYSTPNTYRANHSRITSPTVTASCPTINVRCPSPNQVWSSGSSSCVNANAVHNPSSQTVTHPSNIQVEVTYAVNPTLRFHCWTENPDGTCTPGGTVSTFSNEQTLTNSNPGSRRLCTKAYYENFGGMTFWTDTYCTGPYTKNFPTVTGSLDGGPLKCYHTITPPGFGDG